MSKVEEAKANRNILESEISRLKEEINTMQNELENLKNKENNLENQRCLLEREIKEYEEEIAGIKERLSEIKPKEEINIEPSISRYYLRLSTSDTRLYFFYSIFRRMYVNDVNSRTENRAKDKIQGLLIYPSLLHTHTFRG